MLPILNTHSYNDGADGDCYNDYSVVDIVDDDYDANGGDTDDGDMMLILMMVDTDNDDSSVDRHVSRDVKD